MKLAKPAQRCRRRRRRELRPPPSRSPVSPSATIVPVRAAANTPPFAVQVHRPHPRPLPGTNRLASQRLAPLQPYRGFAVLITAVTSLALEGWGCCGVAVDRGSNGDGLGRESRLRLPRRSPLVPQQHPWAWDRPAIWFRTQAQVRAVPRRSVARSGRLGDALQARVHQSTIEAMERASSPLAGCRKGPAAGITCPAMLLTPATS